MDFANIFQSATPDARSLMKGMMTLNANTRLSARDALKHEYVPPLSRADVC